MTKRLILIRHAKSSWKFPELDDHDRPLNKRGKRDCPRIAEYLRQHEANIDAIYSSSAVRAASLANAIGSVLQIPVQERRALYTFGAGALASAIRQAGNQYRHIAVVGHNPAITEFANYLGQSNITNVPTSGVVALICRSQRWSELSAHECDLDYFIAPKSLPDAIR